MYGDVYAGVYTGVCADGSWPHQDLNVYAFALGKERKSLGRS